MIVDVRSNLYLMPGNTSWQSDNIQFNVEDFGSWLFSSSNSNADVICLTLFLDDIFDLDQINSVDGASEIATIEKFEHIKSVVAQHAQHKPTIICWHLEAESSPVSNAKMACSIESFRQKFLTLMADIIANNLNAYSINLQSAFAVQGVDNCLSRRNFYLMRCPLSFDGLTVLKSSIEALTLRIRNPSKKVIAVDCDNTIWGGVVGEDGYDYLKLGEDGVGQVYRDIQRLLIHYKNKGFILCMLSKNLEEDVLEVFSKRSSMVLNLEDFVGWRINWQPKYSNIRELASELNVGLDSFIFIDDNPLEREQMKRMNPEVQTLELPKDVFEWPEIIAKSDCFKMFLSTDEDRKKTEMYLAKKKFDDFIVNTPKDQNLFVDLEMEATFERISRDTLSRAEQLCQKTNQFNMSTKRYNRAELEFLMHSEDSEIFCVSLRDRFGNHGIVGLFIVHFDEENHFSFIDTFLLSCRVLGRNLEKICMDEILRLSQCRDIPICFAEYVETKKNAPFGSFFKDFGMCEAHEDVMAKKIHAQEGFGLSSSGKLYRFNLSDFEGKKIDYFDIKELSLT